MKVILKADVKGSGKKGDLIDVSDGYAKNFLLKKGLAEIATASGINEIEQKKLADSYHKAENIKAQKALAAELSGKEVTVRIRTGEPIHALPYGLHGKIIDGQDGFAAFGGDVHPVLDKQLLQFILIYVDISLIGVLPMGLPQDQRVAAVKDTKRYFAAHIILMHFLADIGQRSAGRVVEGRMLGCGTVDPGSKQDHGHCRYREHKK